MRPVIRPYLAVILMAAAVGLADTALLPYLQASGASADGPVDVITTLLCGIAGSQLACWNNLAVWWRKWPAGQPTRHMLVLCALALASVLLTTGVYALSPKSAWPAWARSLTPDLAILLALRAAVGEELLFRLFAFSLIAWLARQIHAERGVSIMVGAILSSAFFTLIHQGFYLPFAEGLLLAGIYLQGGIMPAIATHFVADAIPFLILAAR